jgi:YHS domain-containing protein
MIMNRRQGLAASLLCAVGLALGAADAAEPSAAPQAPVQIVESKKVCMVNNQFMDKDQIPVEVAGRTYYGCCMMCKARLAEDAASRTAVDPVSGKEVDKATATIGMLPDGSVLYFENAESVEAYNKRIGA